VWSRDTIKQTHLQVRAASISPLNRNCDPSTAYSLDMMVRCTLGNFCLNRIVVKYRFSLAQHFAHKR
jgi:hypothetical protein